MGVIIPSGSAPALSAGRSTVEGYNPKLHDPFFDGVSSELADKGFITAAADDTPLRFTWQGRTHDVDAITRAWRVRTDWWRDGAWRAYYRLTTTTGLLVVIYHDLNANDWFLQRLFD